MWKGHKLTPSEHAFALCVVRGYYATNKPPLSMQFWEIHHFFGHSVEACLDWFSTRLSTNACSTIVLWLVGLIQELSKRGDNKSPFLDLRSILWVIKHLGNFGNLYFLNFNKTCHWQSIMLFFQPVCTGSCVSVTKTNIVQVAMYKILLYNHFSFFGIQLCVIKCYLW